MVADEAAASRVSLCPAADVVDATLNHSATCRLAGCAGGPAPSGGWAAALPAAQARPGSPTPPMAACRSPRTRDLAEQRPRRGARQRSETASAATRCSAAPPRRCGLRTSVRRSGCPRATFPLPYDRADSARLTPSPRPGPRRRRPNPRAAARPPLVAPLAGGAGGEGGVETGAPARGAPRPPHPGLWGHRRNPARAPGGAGRAAPQEGEAGSRRPPRSSGAPVHPVGP